jgi:hypothetical protein
MTTNKKSIITAAIITILTIFFATRPGTAFNMIGYGIALSLIPEKSSFAVYHEKFIIYTWAIVCG